MSNIRELYALHIHIIDKKPDHASSVGSRVRALGLVPDLEQITRFHEPIVTSSGEPPTRLGLVEDHQPYFDHHNTMGACNALQTSVTILPLGLKAISAQRNWSG